MPKNALEYIAELLGSTPEGYVAGLTAQPSVDTRGADYGTISQGNWLDFNPTLKAILSGAGEMTGIEPSRRFVERLMQLKSPVLRPQSGFEWADWGAGTAAEGIQTGLAAADLAGVVSVMSPAARQILGNQRGQVENIFKNLSGEDRFNRMSPRQQKLHEMKISHEDELVLYKYPTFGMSDEKVKNISAKIRRDAFEQYNKYKTEFEKTGVIDTGYHDLFGGIPTKEESLKLLFDAKKEMEQAIAESEQYINNHEKIKKMFFKDGEWEQDTKKILESGGTKEDLLKK
jgi:hypothetical protein